MLVLHEITQTSGDVLEPSLYAAEPPVEYRWRKSLAGFVQSPRACCPLGLGDTWTARLDARWDRRVYGKHSLTKEQ